MMIKRMRRAGAQRMTGNASVSWLALLVSLACASYVFWIQSAQPGPQREALVEDPGQAQAVPGETRDIAIRLARLEDRLPGALAASESAREQAEKHEQAREQIRRLYEKTLQDSTLMTLQDVESLLGQANRALIGSTDYAGPVSLLAAARERIARAATPQLSLLSEALEADRETLLQLGERSVALAADQLQRLAAGAAGLALAGDPQVDIAKEPEAPGSASQDSFWRRVVKSSEELVSLPDRPNAQAFTPATARYFLIENLRLRLLSARLSLLQHDRAGFEADRSRCVAWLNEHFDSADKTVADALVTLTELKPLGRPPANASVQRSLDALRTVRENMAKAGEGGRS